MNVTLLLKDWEVLSSADVEKEGRLFLLKSEITENTTTYHVVRRVATFIVENHSCKETITGEEE